MNRVLITAFIALLWLPTLDSLFKIDHCPPQVEKRKLADFPNYQGAEKLGDYLAQFQNYFNDHFGFRNQLVHWNNHWKLALFDESPVEMAMRGRDGWLYWSAGGMLADYSGKSRFDRRALEGWKKLLEARRDWLAARGGHYIFVVVPDKHTIYPEYLPEWVRKSAQPSKLDQLLDYMRTNSTVELLDLRPALIAAKQPWPDYLKTDTHWNNWGAFAAYQQLITALARQLPDLKPLPGASFVWSNATGRAGDLAVCLDEQDNLLETQEMAFSPRPPLRPLARTDATESGGQIDAIPVSTTNPDVAGKAVVFRDSFGEKWIPFIGYHFHETVYFRSYEWNLPFLEKDKPDVVIDEMAERFLNSLDPTELQFPPGSRR